MANKPRIRRSLLPISDTYQWAPMVFDENHAYRVNYMHNTSGATEELRKGNWEIVKYSDDADYAASGSPSSTQLLEFPNISSDFVRAPMQIIDRDADSIWAFFNYYPGGHYYEAVRLGWLAKTPEVGYFANNFHNESGELNHDFIAATGSYSGDLYYLLATCDYDSVIANKTLNHRTELWKWIPFSYETYEGGYGVKILSFKSTDLNQPRTSVVTASSGKYWSPIANIYNDQDTGSTGSEGVRWINYNQPTMGLRAFKEGLHIYGIEATSGTGVEHSWQAPYLPGGVYAFGDPANTQGQRYNSGPITGTEPAIFIIPFDVNGTLTAGVTPNATEAAHGMLLADANHSLTVVKPGPIYNTGAIAPNSSQFAMNRLWQLPDGKLGKARNPEYVEIIIEVG